MKQRRRSFELVNRLGFFFFLSNLSSTRYSVVIFWRPAFKLRVKNRTDKKNISTGVRLFGVYFFLHRADEKPNQATYNIYDILTYVRTLF